MSKRALSSLSRPELALLLVLACVQFTHIVDFMVLMPLGPQLMRIFEISPQQFGLLVSAYTFSAGFFGFFSAFIIDQFDRKTALIVLYVGFALGTIACGLAPNYVFLLAARSLAGAFGGVLGALILAIIGDTIPGERRGQAMGIVSTSFSMAATLGVPFGLQLATWFSWHAPFLLLGGIAVLNTLLIFFVVPVLNRHLVEGRPRIQPVKLLSDILHNKNQMRALAFTFLLMLSQFSVIPFLSPSLVANVGFREDQLFWVYLVGGGATIVTSPLVGVMADRFGKKLVFAIAGACLMVPVLIITHLGPAPVPLVLIVTTLFFVCGNARFIPAFALITSTAGQRTRGSFMSINSSVQQIASGFAAFLSGLIVAKGATGRIERYEIVGYLSAAIMIGAILMARTLVATDEKPQVVMH